MGDNSILNLCLFLTFVSTCFHGPCFSYEVRRGGGGPYNSVAVSSFSYPRTQLRPYDWRYIKGTCMWPIYSCERIISVCLCGYISHMYIWAVCIRIKSGLNFSLPESTAKSLLFTVLIGFLTLGLIGWSVILMGYEWWVDISNGSRSKFVLLNELRSTWWSPMTQEGN